MRTNSHEWLSRYSGADLLIFFLSITLLNCVARSPLPPEEALKEEDGKADKAYLRSAVAFFSVCRRMDGR